MDHDSKIFGLDELFTMLAHERGLIAASLAQHEGNLKATHEGLGLSRKTLYEKMQKYGLKREDYSGAGG